MASPASVSPNSAVPQASGTPINGDDLSIPARDGFPLAATVYRPAGQPKDNVVVVNSATALWTSAVTSKNSECWLLVTLSSIITRP